VRLLAIGLLLVVAACGGGGSKTETAGDTTTTTTTAEPVHATAESTATTAGATPTTAASGGVATPTAAASAPTAAAASSAPAPVPPGTYHYRQSGSATAGGQTYDSPPEGTMVVDAAAADGKQVLHRYIDPEGDPSDVVMLFAGDGMFMLEMTLRQGGQEIHCSFGKMPSPTWPPKVGVSSTGHGDCGTTFQLDITTHITGTKHVTVDGVEHTAYIVESATKISGQVTGEGTQLDWFVPELRLATHTETTQKGTFGTFEFSSSGTSDLVSAKPS
jgi:hypothetical protein